MQANNLIDEYLRVVKGDIENYYKDYQFLKERVKNSTAIYKGEPVDFLYQPLFFTKEEVRGFENLLMILNRIIKKVINEYRNSAKFRSYFAFPELMEELLLVEPGYGVDIPMGRFDIFYQPDASVKFCELNTDGASAMNEVRVLQKVMLDAKALNIIKKNYQLTGFELFYSWLDTIIKNYRIFAEGKNKKDRPNIAIMDFDGEGTIYEFKEFQKRFIQAGYQTVICDPRDFNYTNGKLYYKNIEIDLIYRRATTGRLIEESKSITDFIKAYKDGAVCVVGGLVSQIIHNKLFFAILHDKKKVDFLTEQEYDFIKRYIPYTAVIADANSKVMDSLLDNKNKYILKPFDRFAGKGVYAGRDFSNFKWQDIVARVRSRDYLLQEFVEIPGREMISEKEGKLLIERYGYLLGLFSYNGLLQGLYTRVGRKNIIAAAGESFTIPNYIIEKK
ncbi:hypothetical protein GM661_10530 [Iocasia frigidifontis]|uniref:Glutathionylspermidine synthase pre-ATP-grasp-like domain-containing protein n=1 Tax=Iocasia fonsfrigidae TaxID=2682810 RepID=A0A8A7K9E4_9FIRM|nr:hypothetical protein [Iocasia fonsfrigidae]QTL98376.1 hypothetical protein GM661_10530 [Iocasia fonsfrigidae]